MSKSRTAAQTVGVALAVTAVAVMANQVSGWQASAAAPGAAAMASEQSGPRPALGKTAAPDRIVAAVQRRQPFSQAQRDDFDLLAADGAAGSRRLLIGITDGSEQCRVSYSELAGSPASISCGRLTPPPKGSMQLSRGGGDSGPSHISGLLPKGTAHVELTAGDQTRRVEANESGGRWNSSSFTVAWSGKQVTTVTAHAADGTEMARQTLPALDIPVE